MSTTPRSDPLPTHCFSLETAADPAVLPRVMALFAKRGLVPTAWHSRVAPGSEPTVHVDIEMAGLDRDAAGYIARCMRQVVGVGLVLTSEKAAAVQRMATRAAG
jgi:hypothetical protein